MHKGAFRDAETSSPTRENKFCAQTEAPTRKPRLCPYGARGAEREMKFGFCDRTPWGKIPYWGNLKSLWGSTFEPKVLA